MLSNQPGILQAMPPVGRYLFFSLAPETDPREALRELAANADGEMTVVGLGLSLLKALGSRVDGLSSFPAHVGAGFDVPSTQQALWCWLRGDERGDLVHRTHALRNILEPDFILEDVVDSFRYGANLDLTGYEDGTENPQGDAAVAAAILHDTGAGLDGSSFVAVQQWVHDLEQFSDFAQQDQDNIIGRRKSDNEELDDAPESAHVKRTAQESFEPEAFMLRRSMPWADAAQEGLMFVAFGKSFAAFDAQLKRMVGAEDGIADALFRFTHPISGSFFWCPPMSNNTLDLSAIGLG